jgi:anti-sigma B factor antagonist
MPTFDVALDHADGHRVIRVTGELDIATAPELEHAFGRAAAEPGPTVVDLTATSFCDSTGMSLILRAHQRAEQSGTRFLVVCPPENAEILRVLRLLGFDQVLAVHADLGGALTALGEGAVEDGAAPSGKEPPS